MTEASAKKVYANAKNEDLDPPYAKSFIIDGKTYKDLEDYVTTSERERKAAAERQRQEMLRRDEEARKNTQRNSLRQRISQLERERDSLKGLFAGIKRNKIQREIFSICISVEICFSSKIRFLIRSRLDKNIQLCMVTIQL